MLATDKDALICDLAETYKVFNYQGLPVSLLATLASGLRDNSRIKQKMSGMQVGQDTLLLAMTVDALNMLVWMKTKDAQHKRNAPKSITKKLMRQSEHTDKEPIAAFNTSAEFEKALAKAKGGETYGN
jgi:hypothetical protein